MNIPRYATLAAGLLRRQASQLANPPGPAGRDRGIEAIERALVARRRRRARSLLVLVLVLVGIAVLGLIGTMAGAAAGTAPGAGRSLIEHRRSSRCCSTTLEGVRAFLDLRDGRSIVSENGDREAIARRGHLGLRTVRYEWAVGHLGHGVPYGRRAGEVTIHDALEPFSGEPGDGAKHHSDSDFLLHARLPGPNRLTKWGNGLDVLAMIKWADVAIVFGQTGASTRLGVGEGRRCCAVLLGELAMALRIVSVLGGRVGD